MESSLARHTPQSEEKRGLVIVHTQRVVLATGFGRIQSDSRFEFIAWKCFTGGVRIQSAPCCLQLPVTFFVTIAFQRNNYQYTW